MKCSQFLFGAVSLGIVVLLYLTTSAHCEKMLSIRNNCTMGRRHPMDQLVFNETVKKSKSEVNPKLVEIIRWPFDQEKSVYIITRYEAIDKGDVCCITHNAGGPGYKYVELEVESETDKGFTFQLTIYGYSSEAV